MPLNNVVSVLAVLSYELRAPVLPRLLGVYIRRIGADADARLRQQCSRWHVVWASDWKHRFVCPASLKCSLRPRLPFENVEDIEDLGRFGKGEFTTITVMGDICLTIDYFLTQNERIVGFRTEGLNKFITLRPKNKDSSKSHRVTHTMSKGRQISTSALKRYAALNLKKSPIGIYTNYNLP